MVPKTGVRWEVCPHPPKKKKTLCDVGDGDTATSLPLITALRTPAGEYTYWSDKPIKANPTKIINTVPIMQARPTSPVYHAFAVHATAFALLVYLRNNWVDEALPIMKWLQTQRNFNGGFSAPEVRMTCWNN